MLSVEITTKYGSSLALTGVAYSANDAARVAGPVGLSLSSSKYHVNDNACLASSDVSLMTYGKTSNGLPKSSTPA